MNSTDFEFIIDTKSRITISIPDVPLKNNYYYKPIKKLNKFDEATVQLITLKEKLILQKDILDDIILDLRGSLKKALSNELFLPNTIQQSNWGLEFNRLLYYDNEINLSYFWVWSYTNNIQTLLYNSHNKIYLEIVPTCPNLVTNKSKHTVDKLFRRFMKTYKPYFVTTISHETAQKWLAQCEEIVKIIT